MILQAHCMPSAELPLPLLQVDPLPAVSARCSPGWSGCPDDETAEACWTKSDGPIKTSAEMALYCTWAPGTHLLSTPVVSTTPAAVSAIAQRHNCTAASFAACRSPCSILFNRPSYFWSTDILSTHQRHHGSMPHPANDVLPCCTICCPFSVCVFSSLICFN